MINESDLKTLVENGYFGKVTYVSSNLDKNADKGTQFASTINFVKITVNNGNENIDYNIVIKKQHSSELTKEFFKSDDAFRNEYIMYTEILPYLNAEKLNLFPKLFQGNYKDNETLIFKNVTLEGFRITDEKIFLDYDHIALAMKKLGEFHGLSYLAKKQNMNEFYKLAEQLIETKLTRDVENYEIGLKPCAERAFKSLINRNIETNLLNEVLKKYDYNVDMAKIILKPEEPFTVICLGDFCRNNIFFKYNNDKKPIDIKFFDLQNAIYSTPAVDITFFLYLNTTADLRDKHWDEFLSIYWNGVISIDKNIEFTYQQFLEHFSKRAIYGFLPTSFFLPALVDETPIDIELVTKLTKEQRKERIVKNGGDYGTKLISDIAEHLLKKGYLQKFLELF
ncbi:hypothetical protein O3M35_003446 [Rhynocoris fuscipes]|uniref:CHK kinase-like domain-containing protein n=1 Tax=Rhynocoris fuscipes TaxID=488301 RepID=A0AAW1CN24_9HEMI